MMNSIYKTDNGEEALMNFYDRMLKNWSVEYSETDLDLEMGKTHVINAGSASAPPLILLHGSTSNSVTWAGDIKAYAQNFRVYAIDMPGEPGKSFKRRLSWENEDYNNWLLQVFNALNLKKSDMVGISLGGWVVMKFASRYPEKVGKIALMAPGGLVNPVMSTFLKMISYAGQGEKGIDKTMRLLFPDDYESPEFREFFMLINNHFVVRQDQLKPLSNETIKSIKAPVFMIYGAKDKLFNSKKANKRLKSLIPNAQTLIFKKEAHGIAIMADYIIPFLKS